MGALTAFALCCKKGSKFGDHFYYTGTEKHKAEQTSVKLQIWPQFFINSSFAYWK